MSSLFLPTGPSDRPSWAVQWQPGLSMVRLWWDLVCSALTFYSLVSFPATCTASLPLNVEFCNRVSFGLIFFCYPGRVNTVCDALVLFSPHNCQVTWRWASSTSCPLAFGSAPCQGPVLILILSNWADSATLPACVLLLLPSAGEPIISSQTRLTACLKLLLSQLSASY